ncbi:MAG: sigma-70 family RNA polymerase sigma factor [Myxococcales bacterium]|nr:sigma-70 family RNA polymerase sigma factor [Myxococcales bacterium]
MIPDDRALVARVVDLDDRLAFGLLVQRHQSAVRGLLRRLCAGDDATADDLAQEVFLKAYRNLRRFRGEARFSSWLYRIAYNTFVSHTRRVSPAVARDASQVAPIPPSLARHDLNRAFEHLRPEERAALALTFARDLSHEEAARILECPVGTLKTHVHRGKEKLRELLAAWRDAEVA